MKKEREQEQRWDGEEAEVVGKKKRRGRGEKKEKCERDEGGGAFAGSRGLGGRAPTEDSHHHHLQEALTIDHFQRFYSWSLVDS